MATAATINIPTPTLLMTSTTKPTSSSPSKKSYKAWLREKHLPKAAPIEQCNLDLFSKLNNLMKSESERRERGRVPSVSSLRRRR